MRRSNPIVDRAVRPVNLGQSVGGGSQASTPSSTATLDPTSGANPEIPGLQGIDWENDFPTFN